MQPLYWCKRSQIRVYYLFVLLIWGWQLFLEKEAFQSSGLARRIRRDDWRWTVRLAILMRIWKGWQLQRCQLQLPFLPLQLRSVPSGSPGWDWLSEWRLHNHRKYIFEKSVLLRGCYLRHIKIPFTICNAWEVCRGLFVHFSHSNSFQDFVQKESWLYLELWKSHVDFAQTFPLFKVSFNVLSF